MYTYDKDLLKKQIHNLNILNQEDTKQYTYYEFDTMVQKMKNMNLRVLLWVKLKSLDHFIICLRSFYHFGKYVIIKFIDKFVKNQLSGNNMDFSKVLFLGNVLKFKNNTN